ncbi:hypothetical protein vseg_002726 [Gypsophila vaccaria]
MLSRIISRTHLRLLAHTLTPKPSFTPQISRHFSTFNNGGDDGRTGLSDLWKPPQEPDDLDDIFGLHDEKLPPQRIPGPAFRFDSEAAVGEQEKLEDWTFKAEDEDEVEGDVFGNEVCGGGGDGGGRGDDDEDEEDSKSKEEREMIAAAEKIELQEEEKYLLEAVQGPDRAFGDLVAASGITDAMLDSLIALKNFEGIEGLPPLSEIEDERYSKTLRKSSRYEMELQKQEDAANARVRKVDEKGRAYGTGKRKCSIARVWIQPGEGKFCINDKEFDVYFPMLDHRAALLRPFSETKTIGLWDVKCTVKGGGTTGQVDAIRLGVSRALQNWEPGLRPPLREAGFLTRDPRIVERKKPGKAKARKSFQWVKR